MKDKKQILSDEDSDDEDQVPVKTREATIPKQKPKPQQQQQKKKSSLPDIPFIEPISQPRNMFLYVDPYGRPLNEPLTFADGSRLAPFNPSPIDLVNVAPPPLSIEVSARSKPQPKRRWPEEIDRSSLEKSGGELSLINVDELQLEDFPDFEDSDLNDDDEELEKVEKIEIHRRQREDEGLFNLPPKRFPVFPLLNVPNTSDSDQAVLPIDWNFQLTQLSKLGNYKYVEQADQPLEKIIDDLNSRIQKDSSVK